jgi:predicted secreted protein
MFISSAIVLLPITWFILLLVIMSLNRQTQDEAGDIVEGTPASAPANPNMRKIFLWTSILTIPIWVGMVSVIDSGLITLDMFDFYNGIKN